MKLENIGFYSLSNQRAMTSSPCSQMQRCEMIIIENCNFKCSYCKGLDSKIFDKRQKKQLSLDEMKLVIDSWCDFAPLKNIRFSGGEPTLHKNLVDIIAYAKMKGIERIAISTNGSNNFELYEKLINAGCNDFSISLDADNEELGDKRAGNIKGSWRKVVNNIEKLSKITYVTVGVVLEKENIGHFINTVKFASSLGVSDIRVIPSSQWNHPLKELKSIDKEILDKHPILSYRVKNFINGRHVRGLTDNDTTSCGLVVDDSVVAGNYHYPCVIYMREQGEPIGLIGPDMRTQRIEWFNNTNTHEDPICKANCLDVCIDYNNNFSLFNKWVKNNISS
jgi:molybdenum cofactor biosynthesis enzyme MoaA